ncbi:hypothetical protein C7T96_18855 [Nitratireductor sp. StC3]|nr:hypothetical protein C7T96_18855 [Nitratireductor sp. StC3]
MPSKKCKNRKSDAKIASFSRKTARVWAAFRLTKFRRRDIGRSLVAIMRRRPSRPRLFLASA